LFSKLPKDLRNLLLISLPFALVAAVLFYIAAEIGGWDGLTYGVLAVGTIILWALIVFGYLVYVVIRDGWRTWAGAVVALVLAALVIGGGTWFVIDYRERHACDGHEAFFEDLLKATPRQQDALIADNTYYYREPNYCTYGALSNWLGPPMSERPAPAREQQRSALLEKLFRAGMPPDDRILMELVIGADVGGVAVLMKMRQQQSSRPLKFPRGEARRATGWTYCDTEEDAEKVRKGEMDPRVRRYREILAIFLRTAPPKPNELDESLRQQLRCLGLLEN
jgi:hypothetical protein